MNDKVALVFFGPKKVAENEKSEIIDIARDFIKLIIYYHGEEIVKKLEANFITTIGSNNFLKNYCLTLDIPIKNLIMHINSTDVSFEDLFSQQYSKVYILAIWDGVDETVTKQIQSANKYGYQPHIKMVRRWLAGEKTFV